MVHTEEFSLVRLRANQAAADKVYAGVAAPLSADDVADCIAIAVTRPAHVNVDLMVVKPLARPPRTKSHGPPLHPDRRLGTFGLGRLRSGIVICVLLLRSRGEAW